MEFSRKFVEPADIMNTLEFKELKEEEKEVYLEKKGIKVFKQEIIEILPCPVI